MTRNSVLALASVCVVALAIGCTKEATTPTSPSTAPTTKGASPSSVSAPTAATGGSGETLKVSAPTPQSPTGGGQVTSRDVTLVWSNVTGLYADISPSYHVQVMDAAGKMIEVSGIPGGSGSTTYPLTATLAGGAPYTWRVRAEYQGAYGPWSSQAAFISPVLGGYIKGSELYDPLDNGQTVGTIHGDATLIPGQGFKINSQDGYMSYELPQTLTEGEFSLLVTNLRTNTEGDKTKIMSMAEGYEDIITNNRRMTVEKRGDPAGMIAWRFITHDDLIDTGSSERLIVQFDPAKTYFWKATWRNNVFAVEIREDGPFGRQIYFLAKPFKGPAYDPDPHVIYLGAPIGRSGASAASVDGVIYRQVWVSANPRPSYANK